MKKLTLMTIALATFAFAACDSGPSGEEILANQKALASTLGRDISIYYVDSSGELTITRTGDTISLVEVDSASTLTSYELTGVGIDFDVSDVYYGTGVPGASWCVDIAYGDGPVAGYSASDGLIDVSCADR